MKKYRLLIGVLAAVSMLGVGCQKVEETTNQEVIVPETKIEIEGSVLVEEEIEFNLDFPAFIKEVHVKEGQKVAKGDVLVTLDLEEYQNQIAQKKNEIALYELQLKELKTVLYPQNAHIEQVESSLKLKETQLKEETDQDLQKLKNSKVLTEDARDKALKDYKVTEELCSAGAASKEELTQMSQLVKSTEKQVEDIELTIAQTKQSKQLEIDSLKAQLKDLNMQVSNGESQNQSSVDALALQIETATMQLDNMTSKLQKDYIVGNQIAAPIDGLIIHSIACQKGSRVELIQGPILKGMDSSTLVVSANLPEEYSKDLKIGDKVDVISYTDQEKVLVGEVVRLAENAVENYGETVIKTTIKVEDPEGLLKVGGSVDVQF